MANSAVTFAMIAVAIAASETVASAQDFDALLIRDEARGIAVV